jgi:hypothetical protein
LVLIVTQCGYDTALCYGVQCQGLGFAFKRDDFTNVATLRQHDQSKVVVVGILSGPPPRRTDN